MIYVISHLSYMLDLNCYNISKMAVVNIYIYDVYIQLLFCITLMQILQQIYFMLLRWRMEQCCEEWVFFPSSIGVVSWEKV